MQEQIQAPLLLPVLLSKCNYVKRIQNIQKNYLFHILNSIPAMPDYLANYSWQAAESRLCSHRHTQQCVRLVWTSCLLLWASVKNPNNNSVIREIILSTHFVLLFI